MIEEIGELVRVAGLLTDRGVWEALIGAGPTCSVAASDADVDRYLDAYAGFVEEVTAPSP